MIMIITYHWGVESIDRLRLHLERQLVGRCDLSFRAVVLEISVEKPVLKISSEGGQKQKSMHKDK